MNRSSKAAYVVGGASGIGGHISKRLSKDGWAVGITTRNPEYAGWHSAEAVGPPFAVQRCDLLEEHDLEKAWGRLMDDLGPPAAVVFNAGAEGPTAPCQDISVSDLRATLTVNLEAAFIAAQLAMSNATELESITFIGSTTGKNAVGFRTPYAASKMGLIGLARSLSSEAGPYGVRVNTLCPGVVVGDRWDRVVDRLSKNSGKSVDEVSAGYKAEAKLGKFVQPEDVAALVAYLTSDQARAITGQDINVCAGLITN